MFTFRMYGHTLAHMSARVRALTRVHTHTYTHSRDAAGEQSQRDSEESEEIMGAPLTRADSKSIDLQMLPRGQGHKAEARVHVSCPVSQVWHSSLCHRLAC